MSFLSLIHVSHASHLTFPAAGVQTHGDPNVAQEESSQPCRFSRMSSATACESSCELCETIQSYGAENATWYYDWMWVLKQRDESRHLVDKDSQVRLKMLHNDDHVNEIRGELGNLQMTLVCNSETIRNS